MEKTPIIGLLARRQLEVLAQETLREWTAQAEIAFHYHPQTTFFNVAKIPKAVKLNPLQLEVFGVKFTLRKK